MRIWDISPAYLNRQSLLGEHRELHGLYNILSESKKGIPGTRKHSAGSARRAVSYCATRNSLPKCNYVAT